MPKRVPILLGGLILLALFGASAALPGNTGRVLAEPALPEADRLVVQVFFDDLRTAYRIAATIEPFEAEYERGYLVLVITAEELRRLQDAGLKTEIDLDRTLELAKIQPGEPVSTQTIPGFPCYRTVEETFATAAALAAAYPNLATWADAGDTWEKTSGLGGYDMNVLRLTNSAIPGPKPKVFITSAIHGREYATAELVTRLAESLVNNYGIDADITWILDYHEVHMMFHANPDGRKQAETGLLWRKNTNQNYCGPTSNDRGADLNRNFEFLWGCCGGSSSNQCSSTFRGPSPASEPETQAVQNYVVSQFPDQRGSDINDPAPLDSTGIYLDIHASGKLVLWPWGWGFTPAPNAAQLQTLGRKLAYFNDHEPMQAIGLYPTDGTTDDFAYGTMGVAAYTYEIGTQFFQSCTYFENILVPDNLPSLMYALKAPRAPYMIPSGPDTIDVTVSPVIAPAGTAVNLSAMVDDRRYNNSNGTEPTQNIAAAEYSVDTPPWEDGATPAPMVAADGAFDSKAETVQATIDTSSLSNGRHTVFVRGQDMAGNWGAISAVFLTIGEDTSAPAHVADLDGQKQDGTRGTWHAVVTILVHDEGETPLGGVDVSGDWSNGASGIGTCTTTITGECQVTSESLSSGVASATFSVTNLSAAGYGYEPGSNHDPDGDSDPPGTTLVIYQEAPPPPPGTDPMHVGDLDGQKQDGQRGNWQAVVTVLAHDENENPLADVDVNGSWSGGTSGSSACTTDGSGSCQVNSGNLSGSVDNVTFTVDSMSAAGYVYEAISNHDPDGDSNPAGTAIVIYQDTPPPPPGDEPMHVGDLDGTSTAAPRGGQWNAIATIAVHNENHQPLDGMAVGGLWGGGVTGSGACVTGSAGPGLCTVAMNNLPSTISSVSFTVDSLADGGGVYFWQAADDHDPDGDSSPPGQSITIVKP